MKQWHVFLLWKKEKKGGLRRSISFLLSLVLLLSSVNLPVIAMAEETAGPVICGKEAHEHTEVCYAPVSIHSRTKAITVSPKYWAIIVIFMATPHGLIRRTIISRNRYEMASLNSTSIMYTSP